MTYLRTCLLGAAASLVAAATPVQAADNYLFGFSDGSFQRSLQLTTTTGNFTVAAYDSGWYFQNGLHDPTNTNYIVGLCDTCGRSGYYNNFFLFDLVGISGTVTGAALRAYNPDYISGVLSTWSVWDISTALGTVQAGAIAESATGIATFADLESGSLFGSRTITNVLDGTLVSVDLNSTAVGAINASLGSNFGIGGTLREGFVIPNLPAVPEPATWAMLIAGFAAVGGALRGRKNREAVRFG